MVTGKSYFWSPFFLGLLAIFSLSPAQNDPVQNSTQNVNNYAQIFLTQFQKERASREKQVQDMVFSLSHLFFYFVPSHSKNSARVVNPDFLFAIIRAGPAFFIPFR